MVNIAVYGPEIDPGKLESIVSTLDGSEFSGNTIVINTGLELVMVGGKVFHNATWSRGSSIPVAVWNMSFPAIRRYEDQKGVFEGHFRAKDIGREKEFQMYVVYWPRDRIKYDAETLWEVINGMKQATHMPKDYLTRQIPQFIDQFVRSALGSTAVYIPNSMSAVTSNYGERSVRLSESRMSNLGIADGDKVSVQFNGMEIECTAKKLSKYALQLFGDTAMLGDGVMRHFGLYSTLVTEPNHNYGGAVIRKI